VHGWYAKVLGLALAWRKLTLLPPWSCSAAA
jgi:hypothetical protein